MNCKLIWITPEAEKMILYIARVSSDQSNESTGLLKYLIRHHHWSPFEMASMCIEINTTRAMSQQIIRHRSFSFQEFSQRYASVELDEMPLPEIRMQHEKNRQSSRERTSRFDGAIAELIDEIDTLYSAMIGNGVSKETARMILPMCSPTKIYMAGTIRSWIHYLELRLDSEHTQKEHVDIANEIAKIFDKELPIVSQAIGRHGVHDCQMSDLERIEHDENTSDWGDGSSSQGYRVYRCKFCNDYWGCRYQYDAGTGSDDRWHRFGPNIEDVKRHY